MSRGSVTSFKARFFPDLESEKEDVTNPRLLQQLLYIQYHEICILVSGLALIIFCSLLP